MVSRRIVSGVVGVLLVAGAGGAVAVIDAVSAGPEVHVAALNGVPDDMVVDPVSGHAFVMLSRPNAQAPTGPTDTAIAIVDTRTGAILRIVDAGIGVDLGGLDLDARTGRLVVAGNNQMTLLDTRRGNPVNAASLPLAALSVAIDRRRGHVVVTSDGGQSRGDDGPHLTILDIRTGLPLRDVPLNAAAIMPNGLAIDDAAGRIVVASTSLSLVSSPAQPTPHVETFKRVTVLDTAGHVLRTVTVGLSPGADNNGNGLLIVLDRRRRHALVLDLDTSTISVLDERTGSPIHATSLAPPGQKHSGMSYAPYLESWAIDEQAGYLFMAMPPPLACSASRGCNPVGPGYLDTFDTQTGRLVRVTPVPDARGIVVDSHSGRILVSGNSAGTGMSLSILDSRTGRLLRTIGPSPAPWGRWGSDPVVDAGTDRAYVSGGNGTLCVLDIRDGRVIRTLPLGGQYDRLALDEQARRIILVGELSPSAPTDHWGWMPGWLRSRLAFVPPPPSLPPPTPPTSGKVATLDIPG